MNLLPNIEKDIIKKGLKTRSIIVGLILLSLTFIAGIILLLPVYFLAYGQFATISTLNVPSADDDATLKNILNLPAEIDAKLKLFQSNINNTSSVEFVSSIVKFLPKGVSLDSLSIERNKKYQSKTGTIILVGGTASERDLLVSFLKALEESGSFSSVDVPISSLTKEKNLPFSMTIFIENTK